jgi:hypothetical protein
VTVEGKTRLDASSECTEIVGAKTSLEASPKQPSPEELYTESDDSSDSSIAHKNKAEEAYSWMQRLYNCDDN